MKKLLGVVLSIMFLLSPMVLRAEETKTKIDLSKYNTLNYTQTLNDEEIKAEFSKYEETDDQITIYMFRGKGCGYCRAFLSFLNSITDEYGKYFKLVSFESWSDAENAALLSTISEFLQQPASGVPYIIIGDQVIGGYVETYNEQIKSAITNLYNSSDRYDVFEAYNDSISFHLSDTAVTVIWNFIFIAAATTIILLYIKSSNNKILDALYYGFEDEYYDYDKLENEVKEEKNKIKETPKKEVNKKNEKKKK